MKRILAGTACAVASVSLLLACGGGNDGGVLPPPGGASPTEIQMRTLSSREDMASGGDAVIEVKVPGGTAKPSVKLNGSDITSSLVADHPDRLRGRITGLA